MSEALSLTLPKARRRSRRRPRRPKGPQTYWMTFCVCCAACAVVNWVGGLKVEAVLWLVPVVVYRRVAHRFADTWRDPVSELVLLAWFVSTFICYQLAG